MRIATGLKWGAGLAMAIAGAVLCDPGTIQASDHDEAPIVKGNAALDITDVYVFDNNGATVIIVCWAGFTDDVMYTQPTTSGVYDPEVLYGIHIDNNADNVADHNIYWRFGENAAGDTGIQWIGIPGSDGNVVHDVDVVYDDMYSGARLWTGHADDPFFFDAVGYLTTLQSGNLSFNSANDFLAGLNVTAAAIEIAHDQLAPTATGPIQVWATANSK